MRNERGFNFGVINVLLKFDKKRKVEEKCS
jgi:hypothetical protein